jgi:hypothetical protein
MRNGKKTFNFSADSLRKVTKRQMSFEQMCLLQEEEKLCFGAYGNARSSESVSACRELITLMV